MHTPVLAQLPWFGLLSWSASGAGCAPAAGVHRPPPAPLARFRRHRP
jgi:hypothetical protein